MYLINTIIIPINMFILQQIIIIPVLTSLQSICNCTKSTRDDNQAIEREYQSQNYGPNTLSAYRGRHRFIYLIIT